MSIAQSPSFLFPPISWWQQIMPCGEVLLAGDEPFRKMTFCNRYRIATANGPLLLSVPVTGGRTSKKPMKEVLIDNRQDWQKQHWRSLFSAYGRAPFFEHYGPALQQLLVARYDHLFELNLAALVWITKELRLMTAFSGMTGTEEMPTGVIMDLRRDAFAEGGNQPRYAQVFEDRHGFLPNLSIIDLLMNEGPAAKRILMG